MAFADDRTEFTVADLRDIIKGLRKKLTEEKEAHKAALQCCQKEYGKRVRAEAKVESLLLLARAQQKT